MTHVGGGAGCRPSHGQVPHARARGAQRKAAGGGGAALHLYIRCSTSTTRNFSRKQHKGRARWKALRCAATRCHTLLPGSGETSAELMPASGSGASHIAFCSLTVVAAGRSLTGPNSSFSAFPFSATLTLWGCKLPASLVRPRTSTVEGLGTFGSSGVWPAGLFETLLRCCLLAAGTVGCTVVYRTCSTCPCRRQLTQPY